MSHVLSVWGLILAALCAANLPFVNDRLLAVGPQWTDGKSLGLRGLELVVWYGAVGAIGMWMERAFGQNQGQGWEFYAITGALFLTFAFPGFVYRYLLSRARRRTQAS